MDETQRDPITTRSRDVALARLALAAASLAFAYGLVRLALHAGWALGFRYGLDYGEGVVWQQMRGIVAGHGYAPIRVLPAFVYEYPPLYHLVTYAVASLGGVDPLFAGRLVSLIAMLISALLVGWLAAATLGPAEPRRRQLAVALFAGLLFATLPVSLTWSLLMRVDMVACALTLAGAMFGVWAVRRPAWAVAAGLIFTAALYTKQTCLPAPAAAFVVLWLVRPRSALMLLGSAVASGLIALAAAGGHDFLLNIVVYNINRVVWDHGWQVLLVLTTTIVTLALGALGAMTGVRHVRAAPLRTIGARIVCDQRLAAIILLLLMLGFKTLLLPAILKSGASDNYLIDWFAPIAALSGLAIAPLLRAAERSGAPAASAVLLLLVGIGIPVTMLDPPLRPGYRRDDRPASGARCHRRARARERASGRVG